MSLSRCRFRGVVLLREKFTIVPKSMIQDLSDRKNDIVEQQFTAWIPEKLLQAGDIGFLVMLSGWLLRLPDPG